MKMVLNILILLIMVWIKSIFSAADTAFTYVNNIKIARQSKKDAKAKKVLYFIKDKKKFYGIIEVVITMIELLASSFVAEEFVNEICLSVESLGVAHEPALIMTVLATTIVLSYILLVFGGILPKQIARNNTEKTAKRLINIIWIVSKLNYPFEWLVRKSTKMFSKIFKIPENPKDKLTEEEIKMIIAEGKTQGVIDKLEKNIILNALKFEDIFVKNVMTKKEDTIFVNSEENLKDVLSKIQEYKFTRMPVYKEQEDNVIGILNIKDLIIQCYQEKLEEIDFHSHLREATFVNKNEKISDVFNKMKTENIMCRLVVDNDEKVVGIITMEDILESLVGKIFDEFEEKEEA